MDRIEDIIIHPQKGRRESELPSSGLFFATPSEAARGIEIALKEGGKRRFLYHSGLAETADEKRFVAGPAIGAPLAAMTMEKLIVLGAKRIILFGWCGAIDPELRVGDVVVGMTPVSGEGTSHYYSTRGVALPSANLVASLSHNLQQSGIIFQKANIWSTDAPYREDRIYLKQLHQEKMVKCVDMEYSALCAVAAFRQVEFAGIFLVSDELYHQTWQPGFTKTPFRQKSEGIIDFLMAMKF